MKELAQDLPLDAYARLREVLRHWQRAAKAYAEPDEFRININACIQSLRNVTFVLQKYKKVIPNFLQWYGQWQEALKKDSIMCWCVDARNKIVKEGDLETKSIAKASLVASYLDPPINVFTVSPFASTELIAEEIASKALPQDLSKSGYLCVERQWVAENLTNVELLEALAHAFTVLTKLVEDTTQQKGPSTAYSSESDKRSKPYDVPQCMRSFAEYRIIWLKLPTREVVRIKRNKQSISKKDIKEAGNRYKMSEFKNNGNKAPASLKEFVKFYMKLGKRILEVDGYHIPTVFLIDIKGKTIIEQTSFADQDDKYLFWNNLAKEVKHNKIVEVIAIAEAWLAVFDPEVPLRPASNAPEKKEALQAIGISSKGEEYGIITRFTNINGKIVFEKDIEMDGVGVSFLDPIRRVWGGC